MFCHRCGAAITLPATYCSNCGAPVPAAAAAPVTGAAVPPAAVAPVFAGFWRRLWAAVLDGILLNIALLPISFMLSLPAMPALNEDELSPEGLATLLGTYMTGMLAGVVIGWLYFALLESSPKRATVGKMMLGLQVCDLGGGRLTFARATGRHFASYVSNITLSIGYLMVLFTAKRQALHDIMAGTLVVRPGL
jgi:uncharacterized RDD family membrane protein YckC